jgi:deoxyribonuclease V
MIAAVDVDYRDREALAACVLFHHWTDASSCAELTERISPVEDYQPGQFYRRELPCLLAVLNKSPDPLDLVVVDGYVWLTDETHPGLGAHLYQALGRTIPVIGVAKTRFHSATAARAVLRGGSQRPLYVSAVGIDLDPACQAIARMHGPHRVPTLLKAVDQLCRNRV